VPRPGTQRQDWLSIGQTWPAAKSLRRAAWNGNRPSDSTLEFARLWIDTPRKTKQRSDANWTDNQKHGHHHNHPVTNCYCQVYAIVMQLESVETTKLYCE
jgi:hypothetical protein